MTPRVATVLSARDWESGLVALAKETAEVRMVLRAYRPEEVEDEAHRLDVVVAGAETSWVTPARIATWRRRGLRVVGMFPAGDRPARQRLMAGGADEVLPDDTPPAVVVRAVRLLRPAAPLPAPEAGGMTAVVTGPRGAPGRTEVALALAWRWSQRRRTLLLDLDLEAPGLAVRLGRPPRPDLTDAADAVHETGHLPESAIQVAGGLGLLVGSHRIGEGPLPSHLAADVVAAATAIAEVVVVDAGPRSGDDPLVRAADLTVLVAAATPNGLVRAACLASAWAGPPPLLILNRANRAEITEVVLAARRWIGLAPVVVIPERKATAAAARSALPPHRILSRALRRIEPPQ
jgi:MinD-like ATPase involved in chromosome partitioning or flagellar assembly